MSMDAIRDEISRAQAAAYWGRYQWLQELWRRGERLTLARWGRADEPRMAEEQAMRQLGQQLAALLVGFDEYNEAIWT